MEEQSLHQSVPTPIAIPGQPKEVFQILDIIPDAIIVVDRAGMIVIANAQVERVFGYVQSELVGCHLEMLVPERFRKIHAKNFEHYFLAPWERPIGLGLPLVGLRKAGAEVPVDISLRPLLLENALHVIAAVRDVSEQRRAEHELKSLSEQQKLYDTFLSMVSHELRTPLTSIQVIAQILGRSLDRLQSSALDVQATARTKKALDQITSQVSRLDRLINDLLDVSRIVAGHLSLTRSEFEIGELVCETVEMLQEITATHKINIHGEGKQRVYADRDRIGQVFINLLTNAIKYSPEAHQVDVIMSDTADSVIVSVRDYGIGIAKEHQPRLFERYYRFTGEEHDKYVGLGIGLYIAAEIVRRHNGKIWVESDVGRGATFSFSLPVND
jgi:PAS domain S-box-containing protein